MGGATHAGTAQSEGSEKEGRTPYRVGVLTDNYPYAFRPEGGGELQGFAVELFGALRRVAALNVVVVEGDTATIHGAFEAGDVDMLLAFAYSEQRAERFAFSASYLDLRQGIFVRPELAGVQRLEDLRGRRIMVHRTSLGAQTLIEAGMADSIVYVGSVGEALRRIDAGEGDATLATLLTGASIIDREGYDLVRLSLPLPDYPVYFCFAVQKQHRELLASINEGLAVLHRTGEFDAIYQRWFGQYAERRFTPEEILLAVCAGLAVAFVVAVASALHQRRLRRALAETHEALVRSELHFREVFDATPVPVLVIHVVGGEGGGFLQLTESNPAAWKLFGWADHPGRVLLETRERAFVELWKAVGAVRPGTSPVPAEMSLLQKNGKELHLRWAAVRDGRRILLLLENVTAAVIAAKELRTAEHQLRQSQKLDALGTLTSGIAHDFNNILTGIFGNAELLRLECAGQPKLLEYTGNILAGSRRARDLVRQILTFSRQGVPERRHVDLHEIVVETLNLIRAAVPKSVRFDYVGPSHPVPIFGDPTQIHQVLLNLLTNAAQAIGERPGVVTLALRDSQRGGVDPAGRDGDANADHGARHCIEISDTGDGMPPEVMARAFEPFFTTKTKGRGTGLGLSVAHGIVAKHGGVITIASEVGVGTKITIWLPATTPSAEVGSTEGEPMEPVSTDGPEVLVIDDETVVGDALSRMLTRLGCKPVVMNDPLAAIALFAARPERFAVVLCDLSMPQSNGLVVLERLLAMRPGLRAMLMSGFWPNGSKDKARALGVRLLVEKPIGLGELRRFMAELLA